MCKHWNVLTADPNIREIVGEYPQFLFKNKKNLHRLLCYTNATSFHETRSNLGTKPCNKCNFCTFICESNMFIHPNTSQFFSFDVSASCDTEHVVYLALCSSCPAFFVGKTDRRLKDRVREHLYQIHIRSNTNALSEHVLEINNSHTFKILVLYINTPSLRGGDLRNYTERNETNWIIKLQAHIHPGLNDKVPLRPALKNRRFHFK